MDKEAVQAERKEILAWLTTGIGYEIDGVDYVKLDDLIERYDEAVKALSEKETV